MFMKGSDAQSLKRLLFEIHSDRSFFEAKENHERQATWQRITNLFSKYGVEKYDAFDDVGGLSFALALLGQREYRIDPECSTQP